MHRILYILGALTLIVTAVAGIGVGVFLYKGHALDVESKAFVDSVVPTIAASWSKEQLLERATPELRERAKPEELRRLFDVLSRLGPMVEYHGTTGEAAVSYIAGS